MKYWDTSALLRAWKEGWAPGSGFTRSHTVAEWVSIQTGRGLLYEDAKGALEKRALSPATAAAEARRLFANLQFKELTGAQTLDAVQAGAKIQDVKGPAVHDFMHVRTAEFHKATSIVTLNVREFSKMTKLRLELPLSLQASGEKFP
jgi:hypothetical protein